MESTTGGGPKSISISLYNATVVVVVVVAEDMEWCDIVLDPVMSFSVNLLFLRCLLMAAVCLAFFSLHRCGVFIRFK
jgi:hypothetical protein